MIECKPHESSVGHNLDHHLRLHFASATLLPLPPHRPTHLRGTQGHQGRVLRARLSRHARYAPKEWIVTMPLLLIFLNWSR